MFPNDPYFRTYLLITKKIKKKKKNNAFDSISVQNSFEAQYRGHYRVRGQ